jgi:hypothetical protein
MTKQSLTKSVAPVTTIPRSPRPVPWVAALLVIAGCARDAGARPDSTACAAPQPQETFVFAGGAGTQARVTRFLAPDGTETLHGETELALGPIGRRRIVEDVILDPRGRLEHAEITVTMGHGGEAETRVSLDPPSGKARMTVAGEAVEWSAASDAPWIYAPEVQSRPVATPVAAWVTLRAAETAPEARLMQIQERRGWLVPRDQIAVPTELGTTVLVGNDGGDVDTIFVDRLGLADYGLTLVRVPRGEPLI